MDIEAALRRFELGESRYVEAVAPLGADDLDRLASAFVAHFEASGDLRYLNAILKALDREAFRETHPEHYQRLSAWVADRVYQLRRTRGLP